MSNSDFDSCVDSFLEVFIPVSLLFLSSSNPLSHSDSSDSSLSVTLILLYLSLCASQSVTLSRPCLPREVDQWFSQIAAKAQRGDKKRRRTRLIEVGVKLNQWHELACLNVWFSAAIISCHPLAYL